MDSRVFTSKFEEKYELTIDELSIKPTGSYNIELDSRRAKKITLAPRHLQTLRADLQIDGTIMLEKNRLYETPEAIVWDWTPAEIPREYTLKIHVEGEVEYRFSVSTLRTLHGTENLQSIIKEIKETTQNIVFSRYDYEIGQSLRAWMTHISNHRKKMDPILDMIARDPYCKLSKRKVKKPILEVDRVDTEVINSILTAFTKKVNGKENAQTLNELLKSTYLNVQVEENYLDHDVPENRKLRYHLDTLIEKLRDISTISKQRDKFLRRSLKLTDGEETEEVANEFLSNLKAIDCVERLTRMIETRFEDPRLSFLEKIGLFKPHEDTTILLDSHPHYDSFRKLHLNYNDSAPPPLLKIKFPFMEAGGDQNELYNRMCAVKILDSLLNLGYETEEQNLIRLKDYDITVEMPEGLLSTLKKGESKLKFFYVRRYSNEPPYGSYSTPKKATIALEEFKESETPKIYVFEPVYDPEYDKEKFEAVNVDMLHSLRDAIVDLRNSNRSRLILGGVLLHPSNIGLIQYDELYAVSLRPGKDTMLNEIIKGLLE